MRTVIYISFLIVFLTSTVNLFSQNISFDKKKITEWVSRRYPLFLSGTTNGNSLENTVPSYFTDIIPRTGELEIQSNTATKSYSSVVLVYQGELVKAPLKLRAAVYPILIFSDSILICTTRPKQGSMYSNIESYENNDLVLVSLSAFDRGEIAELPFEISSDFVRRFLYCVRNLAKLPDFASIRCFLTDQLNKYTWSNEFVKQDYFDIYQRTCSSLFPIKSDMQLPTHLRAFSIDIQVKLGDYSFEKFSFPVKFGKIVSLSTGFYNFSHDVDVSFGNRQISGSDLRIDKNIFNQTFTNFDDEYGRDLLDEDGENYDRWNYDEHMLYVPTEQARTIVNSLGDDRILTLRLNLEPRRTPSTNPLTICQQDRMQLERISFVLETYKIVR